MIIKKEEILDIANPLWDNLVNSSNKKDYFGYGGRSEFFGHPLNVQKERIQSGLRKFKDENIEIKS